MNLDGWPEMRLVCWLFLAWLVLIGLPEAVSKRQISIKIQYRNDLEITMNNRDDDEKEVLLKSYKLDKFASIIMGVVITFIFGQLWVFKDDFKNKTQELELRQAEMRGQMSMLLGQIQTLMDKGSLTAQRTEVLVQSMTDRLQKYEQFMNAGRRFTADDGDKLEKRIDRLEQNQKK